MSPEELDNRSISELFDEINISPNWKYIFQNNNNLNSPNNTSINTRVESLCAAPHTTSSLPYNKEVEGEVEVERKRERKRERGT